MLTVGCAECFGGWGWLGTLFGRGSDLGSQLTPFLYQACIEWCSNTSACGEACAEVRVRLHGWAFAGSFPAAYGHIVQLQACHI